MNTIKETKLKKLLDGHIPGTVVLASWLDRQGFSYDLQKQYRKTDWLVSIGTGAFKRPNDTVGWQGGLYALQTQANIPIHVGGLSALSLQGASHYIRLGEEAIYLFSMLQVKLPAWFKKYSWGNQINHIKTSFLPETLGLGPHEEKNFKITVALQERAILECLYLAPEKMDLIECFQLLSGLTNLRPKLVQELLEKCSSIKVKRLFLYLARKTGHQWFDFIDKSSIDLGQGDRSIVKNGVYNSIYKITIPKELAEL